MKTYKIDNSKISEYTKRMNNLAIKILVIITVSMTFLTFFRSGEKEVLDELISMLFTAVILGLLWIFSIKNMIRLQAENLQIVVDENSILREINMDNEPRLNLLSRMTYNGANILFRGQYYSKIDFDNIKSIEKKNGDLWVKAANSNTFNGKTFIIIPRELANFDDLEKELKTRQK